MGQAGTVQWSFESGGEYSSSLSVGSSGTIYAGSTNNKVYAINPDDGSVLWQIDTGASVRYTPVVGSEDILYVGSGRTIHALDALRGAFLWKYSKNRPVNSQPTLTAEGILLVTLQNDFYAIHTGSEGLADSAWPTFWRDSQRTGRAR